MKAQKYVHLQEEQVLWAIIDEEDLAGDDRKHLRECPDCRRKVERFRDELHEFGQKARQSVPPFSGTVRLPGEKPAPVSHDAGWLSFFGATAMVGLVVFFSVMGMESMAPGNLLTLQNQESLLEDEFLMREISDMVESPLSDDMYEISGENGIGFDDDFLQFVVPDIQDDFQS
ncbi:MAG: hypothetical protein AMJ60_01465 [Desulfobacterales bacterium SG8_35]|nr:MAG: hypothetical protein AMJ60_01465 [Desulfobacterales bacterium SG8_35]